MPERASKDWTSEPERRSTRARAPGFTLAPAPAWDSDDSAVRASELRLGYGARLALEVQQLAIPAGRSTAVIGPNGSGKSSLLDAIAGLLAPRSGRIEVFGRRPSAGRAQIAYELQQTRTDDLVPLTVREVVRMGRYPHRGLFRPLAGEDHAAVDDALERLAITHLTQRQLAELSGGERQRTQVLAQRAPLLLLDEPAAALDVTSRQRIAEVLLNERERGNTVIYTTHSVTVAAEADWVVLLAGRVVATGRPDDVLQANRLGEAYGDDRLAAGDAHATSPARPLQSRGASACRARRSTVARLTVSVPSLRTTSRRCPVPPDGRQRESDGVVETGPSHGAQVLHRITHRGS